MKMKKAFVYIILTVLFSWAALIIGDMEILNYIECGLLATTAIILIKNEIIKGKNS